MSGEMTKSVLVGGKKKNILVKNAFFFQLGCIKSILVKKVKKIKIKKIACASC